MKTVLITGASSGIGKATAQRLLDDGFRVFAAARRVEKMTDLEVQGATAIEMDITEEDDVVAAVETVESDAGGVDVLINNAGFGLYGAVEDTPMDEVRYQFEVNLFGLGRLTQLVLPHMREQRSGTIVNMSSMGGKVYTPLGAWYHASKHALEGWSDCLRIELEPFNIDVVVIEPGLIRTEFDDVMARPMIERSGDTPYADLAHKVAKATQASYADNSSSPPSAVSEVISKALKSNRPRTRYAVGSMAKPMIYLRKWTSDKLFDRILMSQV